ncbi:inverse autotransporter beta domain-containing protein [Xenorhabdus taiwanensis]
MNGSDKQYLNSDTHKKNSVEENNHTSNADTQNFIAKNLQMAGNLLSSSPSELAEQAKSYAVGQVNGLVTSEAQKWLSQFGTARINFGLDKKGSRKNSSLDLLLPLYDNKADWLFFSQLGYRNKDSRDTINLGLGGRYFYQDWMYGLNTFYDNDLTGKNQRLGLGGEMWGDYIKLAANTYYRVSNWKNSRDFVGYYERPANGFDISGEFFLPTYPNLGAKLTYEQYFGDEVTLFDRETKQKNPALATLGLSYTPVPLFSLGVDYKQGGSGHSETQFLANLSYRLGIPLSVQLSPENVATARTLAGSRYDLVERNNHIVLEHKAKPSAQLSLPDNIIGYSGSQQDVTVKFSSESPLKQVRWATNKDFEQHGGKLSSQTGNTIKVTLPTYLSGNNQNNNYPIYAFAEWGNNQKSPPAEMRVIVRPFMLKKQERSNFIPAGPLPATGDKKDGYTFDPVITFDTANNAPVKNATINHVQWITDPKISTETGLQWKGWEASNSVNSVALDENGHFRNKPVLVSNRPNKDVKVYLQLDGQPPQLVGEVSFDENPASFHVDKVEVSPAGTSLIANRFQTYTYSAVVLDGNNNPVKNQKITNVNWSKDKNQDGLIWNPSNGDVTTDEEGKLKATLASEEAIKDVTVSLTIGSHKLVSAQPVSFTPDTSKYYVSSVKVDTTTPLVANNQNTYTYTATILDGHNNPVHQQKVDKVTWKITQNGHEVNLNDPEIKFTPNGDTTNQAGELTATLRSQKEMKDVVVSLSIGGLATVAVQHPVTFTPDTSKYHVSSVKVNPTKPLVANNQDAYTYTATILDGKNQPVHQQKIGKVTWKITQNGQDVSLTDPDIKFTHGDTTNQAGELTATLRSQKEMKDVVVSLSIEGQTAVAAQHPVTFTANTSKYHVSSVKVNPTKPLVANNQDAYTYTATILDGQNQPVHQQQIGKVTWTITQNGKEVSLPDPDIKFTPSGDTTNQAGELTATLSSQKEMKDVVVSLSIEGQTAVAVQPPVTFTPDTSKYHVSSVKVNPTKPLVANNQDAYTYTATIFDGQNRPVHQQKIGKVTWTITQNGKEVSLPDPDIKFTHGDTTNQAGELTATLSSQKEMKDVVVSLSIEGQTAVAVQPPVTFTPDTSKYHISSMKVDPTKPLVANNRDAYTYTATILDGQNRPVHQQKIGKVTWTITQNGKEVSLPDPDIKFTHGDTTNQAGELTATLSSQKEMKDVVVSLSIEGQTAVAVQPPVTFTPDTSKYHISSMKVDPTKPLVANNRDAYTYTATILDGQNRPVHQQKIGKVTWTITQNGKEVSLPDPDIKFTHGDTTNQAGELTATLSSKKDMTDVVVSLSIEGQTAVAVQPPVTFTKDTQDYRISQNGIKSEELQTLSPAGYQQYQFMATINNISGTPVKGETISGAEWHIVQPSNAANLGITLNPETKTDNQGILKAIISSTKKYKGNVIVSLKVGNNQPVQSSPSPVDFNSDISLITPDKQGPIVVKQSYNLSFTVGQPLLNKAVKWNIVSADKDQTKVTITPIDQTTTTGGKATATLTSHTEQNVTVTATVDGITTAPLKVRFQWPTFGTIGTPDQHNTQGKMTANGSDYYQFTAYMHGPDTMPFHNPDPSQPGHIPIKWKPLNPNKDIEFKNQSQSPSQSNQAVVRVTANKGPTSFVPCVGIDDPSVGAGQKLPSQKCSTDSPYVFEPVP